MTRLFAIVIIIFAGIRIGYLIDKIRRKINEGD
ncbi:hypothetical protein LCGC14_0946780 [marine sediment metagenome]|uniref:Uncharacterized protein n=1 Tax=marine sediment metagenome TaxID=412755 RepID=A0A0F9RPX1_9ZZZZ